MTAYGTLGVCEACGATVEVTRPTFADSPDPVWRAADGSGRCPTTGTWHGPCIATEAAS